MRSSRAVFHSVLWTAVLCRGGVAEQGRGPLRFGLRSSGKRILGERTASHGREKIGISAISLGRDPTTATTAADVTYFNVPNDVGPSARETKNETVSIILGSVFGALCGISLLVVLAVLIWKNGCRIQRYRDWIENRSQKQKSLAGQMSTVRNSKTRNEDNGKNREDSDTASNEDDVGTDVTIDVKTEDSISRINGNTAQTDDYAWFGWVLGASASIAEDRESGNNVSYGEI